MLATSAHLLHLSLYLQRYVFIFTLSIALQLNSGEIVRKCAVEAHDGGFDGWVYGHERRNSGYSSVETFHSPRRYGEILRNFDFTLPKFHFILPKFYFAPR